LAVGTGFVVGDGLVVTNAHVVAGMDVQVFPLAPGALRADVIGFDPVADLALLRVDNLRLPALPISASGARDGQTVAAAGYGGGQMLSEKTGVVRFRGDARTGTIFDDDMHDRPMLRVSLPTVLGDSGSPVVDGLGDVVGVVFATTDDDHDTLAVDLSDLRRMLEDPQLADGSDRCSHRHFTTVER
jgi:S1-C subfamily serine protease